MKAFVVLVALISMMSIVYGDTNGPVFIPEAPEFLQNHNVIINTEFCNDSFAEGNVLGIVESPKGSILVIAGLSLVRMIHVVTIVAPDINLNQIDMDVLPLAYDVSYTTNICNVSKVSGTLVGSANIGGEIFYVLEPCGSRGAVMINKRFIIEEEAECCDG